jgi:hypothetical protein
VYASDGGNISGVTLSDIDSMSNVTGSGVHLWSGQNSGSGSITGAVLSDINAAGNGFTGLYLQGTNAGPLSVKVSDSTFTANAVYGVLVDDDTSGTWTVDLGGGALGGTGGNRIFGNTLEDIRVDMDGGQAKARNNWWGQAGGPLGGDVLLDGGGNTLDSTNPLSSDPQS